MTEAKRGRGRPRGACKDPAAIARALELIASGECANAREASEHPEIRGRIGWRQIHEARARLRDAKAEVAAVEAPKPAPVMALEVRPVEPAGPLLEAPARPTVEEHEPPAGLGTRERRLWHVEQRVKSLSRMLAKAEAENNLARIGSLSGELRKWLDEQAKLAPPEPASQEDEEARWRAAADRAVAKIERGVREAEAQAACRKCGAACGECAKA